MSDIYGQVIGVLAAVFPSLAEEGPASYNGYAEADYVYVAPAAAGRLSRIEVVEGTTVQAGDVLFRLEDAHQLATLRAAEAEVAVAKANLANLSSGSRSEEIEVIRASLEQAQADERLAALTLERSERLLISGAVSAARVDSDRTAHESAKAKVEQLEAELQVARLPARDAQRIAAEASFEAAEAKRDDARSALEDRVVEAPSPGYVDKVFYRDGEVAAAGAPVVSILPPDTLKALFFVPEPQRASIAVGQVLQVTCSGCAPGLSAQVTRLASSPQYTPPIIYSREERSRLVFRAEARLIDPQGLLPGQPLTLHVAP
ncbi:HlyD family efflux transporter periplasmic adaptor subunit [Pseudooceanicola sp. 216_PA32_1]|uniref:HlyD family efflux transporter periplasmic adaptor subunit n=1 Tax=Pseudooceanicola pacificus TaxID=2676438 RepID=A0A844W7F7_9RHOB|nr:HlyD family efflux transporter periplasmic adaptor subunit [Pseudooceanicola pacificus]MWB78771.1 HlyD family efflux transporter periplasmic adaptor subunit [Pseudooceanicola pacificus]